MAMYKSFFDLPPEQTASTAMPRTVVFSNGTGSGSMTICPLFSGAELYYNDMHLVSFDETPAPARNVIEINHCRVGRYECSFGANSCCYLAAGDFAVCAAARKKSSSCFPLRHYHGITILLDLDAISPEMRKQMEWYGVDLDVMTYECCTLTKPTADTIQSFAGTRYDTMISNASSDEDCHVASFVFWKKQSKGIPCQQCAVEPDYWGQLPGMRRG